jgi:hypothetical protein
MAKKKKKSVDYEAAARARRIVIYAPSAELKEAFESLAADANRTASNLGWHLISEYMRSQTPRVVKEAA